MFTKQIPLLLCLIITSMLVQGSCFGCSSFVLKDSTMTLLCTNFDFYTSKGIMLVNKAGVGKRALVMPPAAPAEWNARFGRG